MKKLISFSGAQCTGKTTLLEKCKLEYDGVYSFVPEVTRLVKREFGVAINDAGSGLTQCLILNKHLENYFNYIQNDKTCVMDRCIWDGWVYTNYLVNSNKIDSAYRDMSALLFTELISKIDTIFYTDPGDIELQDDGVRSTSVEFRNKIIEMFEQSYSFISNFTNVIRLKGTVEERYSVIQNTLNNLN